jgi:hypothetical protein
MRYVRSGKIPDEATGTVQARKLEALARLLQLDGFVCTPLAQFGGQSVPLLVTQGQRNVAVGVRSALLASDWKGHSLVDLPKGSNYRVLNDYILRRNLPDEHRLVSEMFDSPD